MVNVEQIEYDDAKLDRKTVDLTDAVLRSETFERWRREREAVCPGLHHREASVHVAADDDVGFRLLTAKRPERLPDLRVRECGVPGRRRF